MVGRYAKIRAMPTDEFIDKDGDRWVRGATRDSVILKSPTPEFEDNECFRSDLKMYDRWPTMMATYAREAFKALWPNEVDETQPR
jgi:hypothetical protein